MEKLKKEHADEMRSMREEIDHLREVAANTDRPPQLMTPKQCAKLIGVGTDTLYEWRKKNMGPPYLSITERILRYSRDTVFEWAMSHEVK